ncbi:MAG: hypothetical protein ACRBBR_10880 [Cellvibrionaceae bacterium]
MMYFNKFLIVISFFVFLVSCTTAPHEDGTRIDEPKGPGILTGDKGEFSFTDLFNQDKNAVEEKKVARSQTSQDRPLQHQKQYQEEQAVNSSGSAQQPSFEEYKAWQRAVEPGTQSYEEYKEWRQYQEYLRAQSK